MRRDANGVPEGVRDPEYLGDGVYIGHDGYHVVLWLLDSGAYGPNALAMEPAVLEKLDGYRERVLGRTAP